MSEVRTVTQARDRLRPGELTAAYDLVRDALAQERGTVPADHVVRRRNGGGYAERV